MKQCVYLITGTRKGLGKLLAEHYLEKGFLVSGCSRGHATIQHENYLHFELDVSNEKSVISMIRQTRKTFGSIDVLLNNAGIAAMNHVLTTPYQNARNVFDTNFFGTFLFSREVAKVMMKQTVRLDSELYNGCRPFGPFGRGGLCCK